MNEIKITKDMGFSVHDLMSYVDTTHEFTLRDVLCACMNSPMPMLLLGELLQCPYIVDYYNEMDAGEKAEDKGILYLELSYSIEQDDEDPITTQGWGFHGMGDEGDIPQDIIDNYTEEEVQKMRDEGFAQSYAVEFSPIYDLADYPIRIADKTQVIQWKGFSDNSYVIKGKPQIRLIEVLHEIFWELSFLGSPTERDEEKELLGQRVDGYEKAKKDGTLKYVDFEEVKKQLKKNYDLDT